MKKHRVRTLIPFLVPRYGELRDKRVLPKKLLFTKIKRGGKFPTLAKKMGYSAFGLFMEKIIQHSLLLKQEDLYDVIEECQDEVPEEFRQYFKPIEYLEIGEMVREHFPDDLPTFEPEWDVEEVQGHPDVVEDDCVYDIKTTGRFNAMRTETIFQILSYYCLAQKQDLPVTHIGLILPAQLTIFRYDISDWDWEPFWKELCGCVEEKHQKETLYTITPIEYMTFQTMMTEVGTHVHKSGLEKYMLLGRPLQFFVGGNASTKVITLTKKLTTKLKNRHYPPIFIHSPYCLNLSHPNGNLKRKTDDELDMPWVCDTLVKILDTAAAAGLNGVVVHCGKKKKLEMKKAVAKMMDSLEEIADVMPESPNCPLLIETSSGDGGEILCDPVDLAEFYNDLSEEARSKMGICVDTTHVFAAGYDPMEYILELEKRNVPIKLIHFNDSKMKKGSRRDRHAAIGTGYIGFGPLYNVLSWAIKNNIPCVTE